MSAPDMVSVEAQVWGLVLQVSLVPRLWPSGD